jgi:glucosyl-3-phosphoglycerate phosphatase
VAADPALRETFAGSWQGLLAEEIEQSDGARWQAWQSGAEVRPGGGETRSAVADRAQAAVLHYLADVPDGGVLVVATHGGTTRALIGRLVGLPLDTWHVLGGLANCSWSVLEERGSAWRLAEHNAGRLPEPVQGTDDS